jgi:hypothetical protein
MSILEASESLWLRGLMKLMQQWEYYVKLEDSYMKKQLPKLVQYICKMQNKIKSRTVLCTQNLQQ